MRNLARLIAGPVAFVSVAGCQPPDSPAPAVLETPSEFVQRVDDTLETLAEEGGAANWVSSTYITPDTAVLRAKTLGRYLEFQSEAIADSAHLDGQEVSADAARQIKLLRLSSAMPTPSDADKRDELTRILTDMRGLYGAGKYCPDGEDSCKTLPELEEILAENRDYDAQLDAWRGWRTASPPMRADYVRFAALANEGAQERGFQDLADMWKSKYDMPAAEFEQEVERLWGQVKPLYKELHCHVRAKLNERYGDERVPLDQPIPAHLLGNMWAQQWGNIYDLVEPYPGFLNLDVTAGIEKQNWDPVKMTEVAESFFTSLGMPELPDTFWERSMLQKPRDREVVCHASAWDLGPGGKDVRIKQCIEPTEEQLITIHHELGHVYYYLMYEGKPYLYRTGAHDGFHEGIGDTVTLSMTPAYLHDLGLIEEVGVSQEAIINQQMRLALDKIAFLPFGKMIDQWRWKVFSGEIAPENYNAGWWALRTEYQGIAPAVSRSEDDFDPGAKYHIPANTPYTRYFLAHILQFQFQRSLCEAAGHEGPLHECSIFGNKKAGGRLAAMMKKGASQPWPDTLYELTTTREMDASAIIDYFAPLMAWLKEQNQGRSCGW